MKRQSVLLKVYFGLTIFAVSSTIGNSAEQENVDEIETYVWLEREAIGDPTVPNSTIHELIISGLNHADSEVVHCAVSAIALHIGSGRQLRISGTEPEFDRRLQDIPNLYDTLVGMWDRGWKRSGRKLPEKVFPSDVRERIESNTGCVGYFPTWRNLPMPLAYLFPKDDKVYEIIRRAYPEPVGGFRGDFPSGQLGDPYNPGPLLAALHEGKFNHPEDQLLRIELFLNEDTIRDTSTLIARSLGEFRSDEGLEALVQVLEQDNMKYGTPKIPIVEAMIKYEEQVVEYIPLMRESLENASPLNFVERDLKIELIERLVHFEKKVCRGTRTTNSVTAEFASVETVASWSEASGFHKGTMNPAPVPLFLEAPLGPPDRTGDSASSTAMQ